MFVLETWKLIRFMVEIIFEIMKIFATQHSLGISHRQILHAMISPLSGFSNNALF